VDLIVLCSTVWIVGTTEFKWDGRGPSVFAG